MVNSLQNRFSAANARFRGRITAWLFLAGATLAGLAQTTESFEARLERTTISAGESVMLELVFVNASLKTVPRLPTVPGLSIQYRGPKHELSIVNSRQVRKLTLNFEVTPSAVGTYTIPAITVQTENRRWTSEPLTLTVVESENDSDEIAFLRLEVPKTEAYVGEMLPVEIQLYVQSAKDLRRPQLDAAGFTVGEMPEHTESKTRIKGVVYHVLVFKVAVTPVKTGNLKIGPATCGLTLQIPTQDRSRQRGGLFEQFLGGGRYQYRPVTLTSPEHEILVKPLPDQGRPDGFQGAVGRFTVQISAAPTNLNVGDPITLRMAVTGQGNFDSVRMPAQDAWTAFKTYPPVIEFTARDPLGFQGRKTFEQVVIPENADPTALPPLSFSYFDPETGRYTVAPAAPIPLDLIPTDAKPSQPTVLAESNGPAASSPAPQLRHIKTRPGSWVDAGKPLILSPWFVGAQTVPLLAWISALLIRKRSERIRSNPLRLRKVLVDQTVREGFKDLRRRADDGDADAFFGTTFRLLQERLGERLNLPASSITEAVIDDSLVAVSANDSLRDALHELFQRCNHARYAPDQRQSELKELIPKIEKVMGDLSGLPDPKGS